MTDAILAALYPSSERPEWTHAYRGAQQRAESHAATLRYLHPGEQWSAVTFCTDDGARFGVMRLNSDDNSMRVLEMVKLDDYGVRK